MILSNNISRLIVVAVLCTPVLLILRSKGGDADNKLASSSNCAISDSTTNSLDRLDVHHSHNYIKDDNIPHTSSPRCVGTSYHQFIQSVLVNHFGKAIGDAVYDPEIYNEMARTVATDGSEGWEWSFDDKVPFVSLNVQPKIPTHFNNISNLLWWTKRYITTAITKISRDSELEKLYERICVDPAHQVKMPLLETTIVRALGAQVHYFHTVLQLGIDVCLWAEVKDVFHKLVTNDLRGMDPLVLLSGWIGPKTTISEIQKLFSTAESEPSLLVTTVRERQQRLVSHHRKGAYAASLYPLYYNDPPYERGNPLAGKFWNMIRPTAGCSSIIRLCEIADGCRLLCNAEYLLYAGRSQQQQDSRPSASVAPYQHRVIGMGGNNEYEWEQSLLTFFKGSSALSRGDTHGLGWLTSMDCTLTVGRGRRQWNVPRTLQDAPIGYSAASLCASGKATAPHLVGAGGLKTFQTSLERTWAPGVHGTQVIRFTANPVALKLAQGGRTARSSTDDQTFTMQPRGSTSAPQSGSREGPRWFDALTILKMDIEGFEWPYIPLWLREEFNGVATVLPNAVAHGHSEAIDFATAVPHYYTVSLFGLEFHRIGHHRNSGSRAIGALRAHWLILQIYALGFIMVAHEKNEFDQCCFEHAYVHVRHFVRSEMWMILRDEL